jgi:hypothetical protein
MIRPSRAQAKSGVEVIPQPGAAPSPLSSSGLIRRQRATAPSVRGSVALSPSLDRNDRRPSRSTLQSAFALGYEVSNRLIGDDGAQPEVGWVPLAEA